MMQPPANMRPMSEAPTQRSTWVALWYEDGLSVYPVAAHYAEGDGEEQPPFKGWFRWAGWRGQGFVDVRDDPIGWTPIGDGER